MAGFFSSYPIIDYKFGNEITPTLFQNMSVYLTLVDELQDVVEAYTTTFIEEGDRPDALSWKLYKDIRYYWTFYYLNDDIRESGWPVGIQDLYARAKIDYPHWVVTTQDDITDKFLEGDTVTGLTSGSIGTVVKRYLDLGQIIIDGPDNYNVGEQIRPNDEIENVVNVSSNVKQYNAVHHYEDTSGNWVDINPYDPSTSGLIPITYQDRMIARNEELKEIRTFKPDVVSQIQSEYEKVLRRGF